MIAAASFVISADSAFSADRPVELPPEEVSAASEKEDVQILSAGSVSLVRPEEMKGEQKTLPELLKEVPGLHIVEAKGRGAYTVASVRGSTAAEVSVFIDGVMMNLGSEAAVDLSAIPVDNVERIEVYRGYVPARFSGAAMGGVINIITKNPDKPGFSLSAGIGSYGLFKTNFSAASSLGGGNFFFGANYESNRGDFSYRNDNNTPYVPEDDYTAERQNNGYKNMNFLGKWSDKNWSVRLGWERNDKELPYAAPGADKPNSRPGANLDTDRLDFSVARRQRSGKLEWGLRADYLHQNKKYDDPSNVVGSWTEQHNTYITDRVGFALDGTYSLGKNHLLEFLADYANEKLNAEGDIVTTFGGISDFRREAADFHIQDTINLDKNGSLTLTPIVRWNMWSGSGKFSFAAALGKDFGNGWSMKISGGKYNRAPNIYELYGDGAFVRPNQNLRWEEGIQWDAGIMWHGKVGITDLAASLTYFGRNSDNLIEYMMTDPRYGRYYNIGKASVNGVEFETNAMVKKWNFRLSATWMRAINKTEGYRDGKQLPNRPEFEGFFRISRSIFNNDMGLAFAELNYIGENYYDETESIKMDNMLTVGLGLKYSFTEKCRVVFGVKDLFNSSPDAKMYAVVNGPSRTMWYPLQGRTFYLTLTWDF